MNARRLLIDDASERRDAGLRFDAVDQVGVVDVPRGEVGQGAAALVFELDQRRAPRPDRDGLVATAERLQLGLLVGAHHVLVGTQPLALEDPGVEIERAAVLVREVPVSRKIQDLAFGWIPSLRNTSLTLRATDSSFSSCLIRRLAAANSSA